MSARNGAAHEQHLRRPNRKPVIECSARASHTALQQSYYRDGSNIYTTHSLHEPTNNTYALSHWPAGEQLYWSPDRSVDRYIPLQRRFISSATEVAERKGRLALSPTGSVGAESAEAHNKSESRALSSIGRSEPIRCSRLIAILFKATTTSTCCCTGHLSAAIIVLLFNGPSETPFSTRRSTLWQLWPKASDTHH